MGKDQRPLRPILPLQAAGSGSEDKAQAKGNKETPDASSSSSPFTGSSHPLPGTSLGHGARELVKKRRRIGTQTACDRCRERKARCSGHRPSCRWCSEKGLECSYADDRLSAASTRRAWRAREVLNIIKSKTEAEALIVVRRIKENQKEMLPSQAEIHADEEQETSKMDQLPPNPSFPRAINAHTIGLDNDSRLELELMAVNPIAYAQPPSASVFTADVKRLFRPFKIATFIPDRTGSLFKDTTHDKDDAGPHESVPTIEHYLEESFSAKSSAAEVKGDDLEGEITYDRPYWDERVHDLDITFWTNVSISPACASRAISLYLETDHPLLGAFDPDVFLHEFLQHRTRLCSEFLVNTILFLGCQMYSRMDSEAEACVQPFCDEAERLAATQMKIDSLTNLAAFQLLSLAYIGYGKDHCVLRYRNEAIYMARRLKLLGVDHSETSAAYRDTPDEMKSSASYAAWGIFNWTVLTAFFYQQPGLEYPEQAPKMPLPNLSSSSVEGLDSPRALLREGFMGETMPALCKFWRILHGASLAYHKGTQDTSDAQHVNLSFAELKYRELLAWSETLPPSLVLHDESPHHVVVLHIWLHSVVLDLFRPFLAQPDSKPQHLYSFYSSDNTSDEIFDASVKQLKRLILLYRSRYPPSTYSILWHTSLIYLTNAILQHTSDGHEWRFYLLLCLHSYINLRQSFRLAEAVGLSLLTIALREDNIESKDARKIAQDLKDKGSDSDEGDIRATFMADLNLAMSEPGEASVENLAGRFDEMALFQEFTNMGDDEADSS